MKTILSLLKKYKGLILYAVFGVLTTLVNMAVYYVSYDVSGFSNVLSTCTAWLAAVLFAYITNKLWVFESRSFEKKVLIREVISFFSCRILTGVMDVIIMYLAVDVFGMDPMVWKFLSNILVIILNYAASKLFIFKKGGTEKNA